MYDDTDPFCFVCSRCTDHFGEHDALVEAGLAAYDTESGSVYRTDKWDRELATQIAQREYEEYVARLDKEAALHAIADDHEAAILADLGLVG